MTDGKHYAIEKGWWIFKRYRSLYCYNWFPLSWSYNICWGNKDEVNRVFKLIQRKKNITPVKEDE